MHVGKTLTDLQILDSELHQNAFGGRAPPTEPQREILLSVRPLTVVRGGGGRREWEEKVGDRERREGEGTGKGKKEGEREVALRPQ